MSDIIRTWPASVDTREAAAMFNSQESTYSRYYFTLGKGKPQKPIERLWFTFRGRILGYFPIDEVVCNDGSLPQLHSIHGEGEWMVRPDFHVAVCGQGFIKLRERLFMSGFRGWRYFDKDSYARTPAAKMRF